MIRKLTFYVATSLAAGLLFVNVYTSLVDAASWGSDIPTSIQTARDYYNTVNPGNFFRIFSPLNQLITLLAFIICWKSGKKIRMYGALALVTAVGLDALTFAFFYPRNEIMFVLPIENLNEIKMAWSEWSSMNWVRSGISVINLVFDFSALTLLLEERK